MSVVVKGMKMPEKCRVCPFAESIPPGRTRCLLTCRLLSENYEAPAPERNEHCPLVTLPDKHGDLIDRDAFKADYGMKDDCADCEKELRGKVKACEYDRIYSKMDFCDWLDNADVVIEAEDE